MDEFKKNLKQSTGMRIFIFLMAFFVCTLIGAGVAALFTIGNDIVRLKIGQGVFISVPQEVAFCRAQ